MTFEEMYIEYHPFIFRFTTRLLCDVELAEDMTQETFLRAWRGYDKLRPGSNILAWLYRIARNAIIDYLRRNRIAAYPLDECLEVSTGEDMQETLTQRERVESILSRLPAHYREALLLSYVEDYPERLIAEQLGVSRDVVHSRLMRGRERFRSWYQATEEAA